MIKYKLACKNCQNLFDSWFASSKEYERLRKKKFLNCIICDSQNVEKTLMSPSILRVANDSKINTKDKKYKKITKKIIEYQKFIKKNFEYVGENFAQEARSLHYKNKKTPKNIYGTSTSEELKELREEGIEAEVIPWLKENSN